MTSGPFFPKAENGFNLVVLAEIVRPFPALFFSVAGAILSSVKKNLLMLQDGTKAPPTGFFFHYGGLMFAEGQSAREEGRQWKHQWGNMTLHFSM